MERPAMSSFAYYDPDTETTVYHIIPSFESESAPSTFYSETDSTVSATTIESDELPGYLILHHGRQQPASDNAVKWFPSDNIRRYVLRYLVLKHLFGGDYVGPVRQMLAPVDGRKRRALELGTRTGTWIQAMATEFSHVQFLTLDVIPMMPHVPRHNVAFEVYDFTEGLMVADESQDVVFLNMVLEIVKDYRALLREVYRVLRRGGLIYVNDFLPQLWDPENTAVPAQRTNPQGHQFYILVRQRLSSMGIDPDMCEKLPQWLMPDSDLWDKGQRGFKSPQSVMQSFHIHPHDGFDCMDQIGARVSPYVRWFSLMSLRDMSGLVKDCGIDAEDAEELVEGMLEELKQHDKCASVKAYCIYATKI